MKKRLTAFAAILCLNIVSCTNAKPIAVDTVAPVAHSTRAQSTSIKLTATQAKSGVDFSADPAVAALAKDAPLPKVLIKWSAPGSSKIEIHMSSPAGQLFSAGDSSGSSMTGPWVTAGAKFYLQDVSSGEPGTTLAVLTAAACGKCKAR